MVGTFDMLETIKDNILCGIISYPDTYGLVENIETHIKTIQSKKGKAIVVADLLSLTLLKAPGEMGADIVVGNSQRFGVPMGYGGPHAAFFAAKDEYKRAMPGRIIGVSVDRKGNQALRMAFKPESNTSDVKKRRVIFVPLKLCYRLWQPLMEFIMDLMELNILQNVPIPLQTCLLQK